MRESGSGKRRRRTLRSFRETPGAKGQTPLRPSVAFCNLYHVNERDTSTPIFIARLQDCSQKARFDASFSDGIHPHLRQLALISDFSPKPTNLVLVTARFISPDPCPSSGGSGETGQNSVLYKTQKEERQKVEKDEPTSPALFKGLTKVGYAKPRSTTTNMTTFQAASALAGHTTHM